MSTAELQSLILHIFAFFIGTTIGLIVEALTGLLFLAVWHQFSSSSVGYGGAIVLCVLIALLVSATFIDFDHFIIPDSITIGGTVIGVIACVAVPQLMETESRFQAFYLSLLGAAVGFALLWLVVNLGKLAFGKIKYAFEEPTAWKIYQEGEDNPMIEIGEDKLPWDEVIYRKSDRLVFDGVSDVLVNNEPRALESLAVTSTGFDFDGEPVSIEKVEAIQGDCLGATVPREAMGFGDVKFIAAIGAFLGWQSVLFTVFAASIIGAVVGVTQKLIAREGWSRPIPFGPYLALGAVLFMFFGRGLIAWYAGLLGFGG